MRDAGADAVVDAGRSEVPEAAAHDEARGAGADSGAPARDAGIDVNVFAEDAPSFHQWQCGTVTEDSGALCQCSFSPAPWSVPHGGKCEGEPLCIWGGTSNANPSDPRGCVCCSGSADPICNKNLAAGGWQRIASCPPS